MKNRTSAPANFARGSWFGSAEIGKEGMVALVGKELYDEFMDAFDGIYTLYQTGDDLCHLLMGQAPECGIPTEDVPKHQRLCDAIKAIKDKARENNIPVKIGYIDNEEALLPTWVIDSDSQDGERDVFKLSLTAYGRKVARLLGGTSTFGFNTEIIECE